MMRRPRTMSRLWLRLVLTAQASALRRWCLDSAQARGFFALTLIGTLQESWFALHEGPQRYALFLGRTEGAQSRQDHLVVSYTSIQATCTWS